MTPMTSFSALENIYYITARSLELIRIVESLHEVFLISNISLKKCFGLLK